MRKLSLKLILFVILFNGVSFSAEVDLDQAIAFSTTENQRISLPDFISQYKNISDKNLPDEGKATFTLAEALALSGEVRQDDLDEFESLLSLPGTIVPYEDGLESVFFPDKRIEINDTQSFPNRTFVLIATSNNGRCSGWLIGADTVITAGHCVHTGGDGGSWSKDVIIYAGKSGSLTPFKPCNAISLHSVVGWVEVRDKNYDYGAIKLDCEIGDIVGFLGFQVAPNKSELVGSTTVITGYPIDKPLTLWSSQDMVTDATELKVFYKNDTTRGMSGSAVHNGDNIAYAIHTNATHNGGIWRNNNAGTKITKRRLINFLGWIDF